MNERGFIKLPRSLLTEWRDILTSEEIGILVQLMAMANYQDKPKRAPKGDYLKLGQLVTSQRDMSKRFGISASRARRLLIRWEELGLIKREPHSGSQSGSVITLVFYASSQGKRTTNRTENRTPIRMDANNNSPSPALNDPDGEAKKKKVIYTR